MGESRHEYLAQSSTNLEELEHFSPSDQDLFGFIVLGAYLEKPGTEMLIHSLGEVDEVDARERWL